MRFFDKLCVKIVENMCLIYMFDWFRNYNCCFIKERYNIWCSVIVGVFSV